MITILAAIAISWSAIKKPDEQKLTGLKKTIRDVLERQHNLIASKGRYVIVIVGIVIAGQIQFTLQVS
jgi:hypothetical protein